LKYLNAIIKESLRIFPPSSIIMFRESPKPFKMGPYTLPTNNLYLINIWQIHHDPKYWENPEQYDPERFLRREK
jgi:cytochrome P450 family 82 subfamily G polypeptide 1